MKVTSSPKNFFTVFKAFHLQRSAEIAIIKSARSQQIQVCELIVLERSRIVSQIVLPRRTLNVETAHIDALLDPTAFQSPPTHKFESEFDPTSAEPFSLENLEMAALANRRPKYLTGCPGCSWDRVTHWGCVNSTREPGGSRR